MATVPPAEGWRGVWSQGCRCRPHEESLPRSEADRFTQDMDDITTGVGPCADVAFPEGRRTAEAETFGSPRGAPGSALGPRAAPQGAALGALSARQGGVARRRSEEKSAQTSESVCLRRLLFLGSPRAWAHVSNVLALPPGGARGPWGPAPPGEAAPAVDCSAAARARCSAPSRRRPRRRAISCELSACLASLGRVHCFSARAIEEHL
ncbi:unnamed protein product [Prorocentrum cordatum]|uniref:Uncharacterized protein n=1 Tax=Prorocentrum cordatum TaxID=2364126 RepID=A0ABN9SPS5_9DINO|nr:unnamed protein product [Polarella glacialis]